MPKRAVRAQISHRSAVATSAHPFSPRVPWKISEAWPRKTGPWVLRSSQGGWGGSSWGGWGGSRVPLACTKLNCENRPEQKVDRLFVGFHGHGLATKAVGAGRLISIFIEIWVAPKGDPPNGAKAPETSHAWQRRSLTSCRRLEVGLLPPGWGERPLGRNVKNAAGSVCTGGLTGSSKARLQGFVVNHH